MYYKINIIYNKSKLNGQCGYTYYVYLPIINVFIKNIKLCHYVIILLKYFFYNNKIIINQVNYENKFIIGQD